MKSWMKWLGVAALAWAGVASGDENWWIDEDGVTWGYEYDEWDEESATVTGAYPLSGALEIPALIDGRVVTGIGDSAFFGCDGLTSVAIPASVTEIGNWAFENCSELISVTLGEGVRWLGDHVFSGCESLETIFVQPGNCDYESEDGVLFERIWGEGRTLVHFPEGRSGSYEIPADVVSIGDAAFEKCIGLTSVTISEGVTNIGNWAFSGCRSLASVAISRRVRQVGRGAFSDCRRLTDIYVDPNNRRYAAETGVLFRKDREGRRTLWQFPAGNGGAYEVPDDVVDIGASAFEGCGSITSITISSNVMDIGAGAFERCGRLESFDVKPGNERYASEDGVLFEKVEDEGRALVQFPAGKGGSYAIPSDVTSIGELAFCDCAGLTSVTFPGSVGSIGAYAFAGCWRLSSMTIPGSVSNIAAWAFSECMGLGIICVDRRWEGTDYLDEASLPEGCEVVYYDPALTSMVSLDACGGAGGTAAVTATFGAAMPPAVGPTLAHYTFMGYFDATNGGTRYYDGAMRSAKNWDHVEPRVTLYAQWRGNPSVITLNANGGTAGTARVTAYYGKPMPKVAKAPYRTGYILQGFYSAKSGGTQYWDGDMNSKRAWDLTRAAYTFYARWKKSTTTKVTFDANGGKPGTMSTTATCGAPMPPATAPKRTGYTFQGYYSAKSGGTKFYDSKMASVRKWSGNVRTYTLYAHWLAKKSTVTILGNGGMPESILAPATYGKAMPKITPPTRKGYTLLGIYNAKSAGTKYWTAAGASVRSWNLTGSQYTFYAQWKPKTTTITLNPNGGSGGTAKVTATYSKAMPKATAPTRKGCRFLGYYTAKTGGTQYYDAKMASVRKWTSSASKYTLYAQWTRIATITLNANGGSNGTAKVTATYGKAMPKARAPIRKGYTFLGYYNTKTGGTQYYSETMASARNWNGTGMAYTFYARWARNATIAINANGGSNGTAKVTAAYGKPMPAATAPVREGYDFLGIFNKRAGGTSYWTAEMTSARNWNGTAASYTFYAQWMLSGLDPDNGVLAYNGPLGDAVADADGGWSVADGDETTAWTGDEGVGEWHLRLGFNEEQAVGGIQVIGENLPEDGVTFAITLDGGLLKAWDGATPITFDELLLSIVNPDGIPPMVREIYFQSIPEL